MWSSTAKSFLKSLSLALPERLCLSPHDCRLRQKKKKSESPFSWWPIRVTHRGEDWEEFKTQSNSRVPTFFWQQGKAPKGERTQFVRPDLTSSHSAWRYFSFWSLVVHPLQGDRRLLPVSVWVTQLTPQRCQREIAWNERNLPIQLCHRAALPIVTCPTTSSDHFKHYFYLG